MCPFLKKRECVAHVADRCGVHRRFTRTGKQSPCDSLDCGTGFIVLLALLGWLEHPRPLRGTPVFAREAGRG